MSHKEKLLGLLGLAFRAQKLVIGRDAVERSLSAPNVFLVIFAADVQNQSEKFAEKIKARSIPVRQCLLSKKQLGHILKKDHVGQVAVLDPHFSRGMIDLIDSFPGRKSFQEQP